MIRTEKYKNLIKLRPTNDKFGSKNSCQVLYFGSFRTWSKGAEYHQRRSEFSDCSTNYLRVFSTTITAYSMTKIKILKPILTYRTVSFPRCERRCSPETWRVAPRCTARCRPQRTSTKRVRSKTNKGSKTVSGTLQKALATNSTLNSKNKTKFRFYPVTVDGKYRTGMAIFIKCCGKNCSLGRRIDRW